MSDRRGAVLLEAVVSLAILSLAGGTVLTLLGEGLGWSRRITAEARQLESASRVLTAMTLLTRRELDLRLGVREVGDLVVTVGRPERSLYRIAVSDPAAPAVDLLVTVVHR